MNKRARRDESARVEKEEIAEDGAKVQSLAILLSGTVQKLFEVLEDLNGNKVGFSDQLSENLQKLDDFSSDILNSLRPEIVVLDDELETGMEEKTQDAVEQQSQAGQFELRANSQTTEV